MVEFFKVMTNLQTVLNRLGGYTYQITSSRKNASRKRTLKVNVNDIKKFTVPDTSGWKVNKKYLNPAMALLNCKDEIPVILDFTKLEFFTLDTISNGLSPKAFIIPEWPCMGWYKPLHELIVAEAVQLEDKHDLFLDSNDNSLGCFAGKHWPFYFKGN